MRIEHPNQFEIRLYETLIWIMHHTTMPQPSRSNAGHSFWDGRLKASGIHLGVTLAIGASAAALVFGIWYPYPYREISGGRELFVLLVTVDVVVGPLITLVVFNRNKPWPVMRRDLTLVAVVQLAALGYGLWTVFVARPVHLVFEYKRFSVIHAIDVPPEQLDRAPPAVQAMPLWGPTLLSLRPFKDNAEMMRATMDALGGVALGARPDLWQPYAAASAQVLEHAQPLGALKTRFADRTTEIDAVALSTGRAPETLVYLPMTGRKSFWTVLLDPATAEVLGFLPLDPF